VDSVNLEVMSVFRLASGVTAEPVYSIRLCSIRFVCVCVCLCVFVCVWVGGGGGCGGGVKGLIDDFNIESVGLISI
jgi:hypothetical protein